MDSIRHCVDLDILPVAGTRVAPLKVYFHEECSDENDWLVCRLSLSLCLAACGSQDLRSDVAESGHYDESGHLDESATGEGDTDSWSDTGTSEGDSSGDSSADVSGDTGSSEASESGEGTSGESEPGQGPEAGQLTAGSWDDNENYQSYLGYRDRTSDLSYEALAFADRRVIEVTDASGQPVGDAQVTLVTQNDETLLQAKTVSDGRVLYFADGNEEELTLTVSRDGFTQTQMI